MNRLTAEKRAEIIGRLTEGMSIRAAARVTGAAKNTITKLLVDLGETCSAYQHAALVDLSCRTFECDEVWNFAYVRDDAPTDWHGEQAADSVWTWTVICTDTKLIPAWFVGERTADDGYLFMMDLRARLKYWPQITTDGLAAYATAIGFSFGAQVDWAVPQKIDSGGGKGGGGYSPAAYTGTEIETRTCNHDRERTSTRYAGCQNLTMRMNVRRFTRLTNAFSKKIENLAAAVSLHYLVYNFARRTLASRIPICAPPLWRLAPPIMSGRSRRSRRCWIETDRLPKNQPVATLRLWVTPSKPPSPPPRSRR